MRSRTYGTGSRVDLVKLPSTGQRLLNDGLRSRRLNAIRHDEGGLGVEIPTEALEMGENKNQVGVVYLLGRVATTRTHSADSGMGGLEAVEVTTRGSLPVG